MVIDINNKLAVSAEVGKDGGRALFERIMTMQSKSTVLSKICFQNQKHCSTTTNFSSIVYSIVNYLLILAMSSMIKISTNYFIIRN